MELDHLSRLYMHCHAVPSSKWWCLLTQLALKPVPRPRKAAGVELNAAIVSLEHPKHAESGSSPVNVLANLHQSHEGNSPPTNLCVVQHCCLIG
ncbi:hypothetical protein AVEN_236592-1 [Araneus ventricosus]|uniref:Uncharacterized protein n=1 Tax=Araneus ventricosus TaxID=182803 RepID=A0A4Y2J2Y5_ARAVE|nr:hypothetical protein AVEN_236592-1 [Araneus ventricosus]